MEKEKKSCFVIMPFSKTTEEHTEAYWKNFFDLIEEIMEKKEYSCKRSEVGPYDLFSNIVQEIEKSDVVIAVLTDFNANVWYELGIRHTLRTGTIMLLQEGQTAPFDIKTYGIYFYKEDIGFVPRLEKHIEQYLKKLDGSVCDSPVKEKLQSNVNDQGNNSLEKKLEKMEQLIWKLIDERSGEKIVKESKRDKRNKVLWVDDYPSNNTLVMDFLHNKSVHFDIAITTEQGIRLYKANEYDLILTDMGRGLESDAGLKLIKELNALHCKTPIGVFASSRAISRYGSEALKLGAQKVTNNIGEAISFISNVLGL